MLRNDGVELQEQNGPLVRERNRVLKTETRETKRVVEVVDGNIESDTLLSVHQNVEHKQGRRGDVQLNVPGQYIRY